MSEGNNDKINNSKKSKSKLILIIVAILIITNCSSLLLGNYLASRGRYFTSVSNKVENSSELMSDTKKYESLFMVRDTLLKKYDGEINDDALLEGAIKGMTNALGDPYTVFLNSEEFDKLMKESQGSLDGIGVQVGAIENKIVIIAPIKDSPSDKAGLLSGDIIEKIDGTVYSGEQLNEAVSYITSPERDQVKLTIKRKDENSFDVKVKKEEIKIKSLEGEMVNSNIGYIKIDTFMNENTASDFKDKIKELEDKGMKGLILDLRNNPGGLLSEAIGVASQFIPKDNVITYTIDKYENKNESLSVGGIAQGMPLVVLVDNGSASASEVVTGALRDYKAATIVGTNTFGKGIVQAPVQFDDGSALKVTISKYYTPNGENIHHKGIKPDDVVEIPKELLNKPYSKDKDNQLKKALEVIDNKINK